MAREYRYKEREIAGYIQKDPAVVTRYLNEKEDLEVESGKVIGKIRWANINNQV